MGGKFGNFGNFGKSSTICQTNIKPSKVAVTINNPLADLFICQPFSTKCLERVNSPNILPAKLSRYLVLELVTLAILSVQLKAF